LGQLARIVCRQFSRPRCLSSSAMAAWAQTSSTERPACAADISTPRSGAPRRRPTQVRWDWENDGDFDTLWSGILTRDHQFDEAGLHLVRVEVRDAEGLTDAAVRALLVLPGDIVTLAVTPGSATLAPGEILQFRATAWDTYDNQMNNPSVTWSVTEPPAGTISASGLFTAGLGSGTYPDGVQVSGGGQSDAATVTLVWPYRVYLPLVQRDY